MPRVDRRLLGDVLFQDRDQRLGFRSSTTIALARPRSTVQPVPALKVLVGVAASLKASVEAVNDESLIHLHRATPAHEVHRASSAWLHCGRRNQARRHAQCAGELVVLMPFAPWSSGRSPEASVRCGILEGSDADGELLAAALEAVANRPRDSSTAWRGRPSTRRLIADNAAWSTSDHPNEASPRWWANSM